MIDYSVKSIKCTLYTILYTTLYTILSNIIYTILHTLLYTILYDILNRVVDDFVYFYFPEKNRPSLGRRVSKNTLALF